MGRGSQQTPSSSSLEAPLRLSLTWRWPLTADLMLSCLCVRQREEELGAAARGRAELAESLRAAEARLVGADGGLQLQLLQTQYDTVRHGRAVHTVHAAA
jgi:hypothetical protein